MLTITKVTVHDNRDTLATQYNDVTSAGLTASHPLVAAPKGPSISLVVYGAHLKTRSCQQPRALAPQTALV